jgi:hypothetical protein
VLIARWGKLILGIEMVLAAVYIAVDVPRGGEVAPLLFPWTAGLSLVAAVLAVAVVLRRRPAVLVMSAGNTAFDTPASSLPVLAFTALAPIATEHVSTTIDRAINDVALWWFDVLWSAFLVLVLAAVARAVWAGFGVRLSRDALTDRRPYGTLAIPWETLAAATAAGRDRVALTYRNPDPIGGSGTRRTVIALNVDSAFLARAIQQYASHPEHRPAIGTDMELRRITAAASA